MALPARLIFLVTTTGTHPLGHGTFARQIWRAAKAPPGTGPPENTEPADTGPPGDTPTESRLEQALQGLLDAHRLAG